MFPLTGRIVRLQGPSVDDPVSTLSLEFGVGTEKVNQKRAIEAPFD